MLTFFQISASIQGIIKTALLFQVALLLSRKRIGWKGTLTNVPYSNKLTGVSSGDSSNGAGRRPSGGRSLPSAGLLLLSMLPAPEGLDGLVSLSQLLIQCRHLLGELEDQVHVPFCRCRCCYRCVDVFVI